MDCFLNTGIRLGHQDLRERLCEVFCGTLFTDYDWDPSIGELVTSGTVSRFFDFLDMEDMLVEFEDGCAPTYITSGTSALPNNVTGSRAVLKLIELYKSCRDKYQRLALWAFGNNTGDSLESCGHGHSDVCDEFFFALDMLLKKADLPMLQIVSRTLNKFCSHLDPDFPQKEKIYSVLQKIHVFEDVEVLSNACWALANTFNSTVDDIDIVIPLFCPKLSHLLDHYSSSILFPVLLILGKILSGNDEQCQHVIEQNVLPKLIHLLRNCDDESITKLACFSIAAITSHCPKHVEAVVSSNLVGPLVDLLNGNIDCKQAALLAILNVAVKAPHQIRCLVEGGVLVPVCDLLASENNIIIKRCLKVLVEILGREANDSYINEYKDMIYHVGGVDNLRKLEFHHDIRLFKEVVELLNKYWLEEECDSIWYTI